MYPDAVDQTKKLITTYAYTFYTDTCQVQEKTTTFPVVDTDQNGSGVAAVRKEYFNIYGNLEWIMDERGFITRMKYDIVTGAVTQLIQDVDTSLQTGVPSGWETPTGGGLNLVTDFEHDDLGRTTQALGPEHTIDIDGEATSVRRASWTVYQDEDHELWTAQGYATGEEWDEFTLINPVSTTKFDKNGHVLESIQAVREDTSGKLEPDDEIGRAHV